ncbi:MAG TPA: hypothetical protein VLK84_06420 [Longimicrobium sp.]|nr:hypothetical protein [Longimicrobium sp.]
MERRADRWVLGLAALVLALTALVVWGFVRVPGEPWRTFPETAMRADTGVELRVMLRRDTLSSRDRTPVEVLYFIVNGPSQVRFDNDPERFSFRVETPDGRLVQPASWTHRPTGMSAYAVTLPAGAVFGQMENLRCVRYSAYGRSEGTRWQDCLVMWDFATPGTYRVIVAYRGRDRQRNLDSLLADTTSIIDLDEKPLAPGWRLADTATLVVR